MSVILLEPIPESPSIVANNDMGRQLFQTTPEKIALATKRPRKMTESLPLARVGRAYGNGISKLNLTKPFARRQSEREFREPWHSSSKTDTREYGDYYGWQARLTYLEMNRMNIIAAKGVKHFVDEYMKKLLKCEIFERGHKVEMFASARYEMLNKGSNSSVSKNEMVQLGKDNFDFSNRYRKNAKGGSIPVSAVKTIDIIRKYRSGQSIDDLLVAIKEVNSSSGYDHSTQTITLKNVSSSMQSQKIISAINVRSNSNVTNSSSLKQNRQISPKQNKNPNRNIPTAAAPTKLETITRSSVPKQQKEQKRKSLDRNHSASSSVQELLKNQTSSEKDSVKADEENRLHMDNRPDSVNIDSTAPIATGDGNYKPDNKSDSTSNHNSSMQNQNLSAKWSARRFNIFGSRTKSQSSTKDSSVVYNSDKSGSVASEESPTNHDQTILENPIELNPTTSADESSIIPVKASSSGHRFNIFGSRIRGSGKGRSNNENTGQGSRTEHDLPDIQQETAAVSTIDGAVHQSNIDPTIAAEENPIDLKATADESDIPAKASTSRRILNIFGFKVKNSSEIKVQKVIKSDSAASHNSTTENEPEHNDNAGQGITDIEDKALAVPIADVDDSSVQKSNFSKNRPTLYRKYTGEKTDNDNASVKSAHSAGSFDKDKFVQSEKALYPRTGSILGEIKLGDEFHKMK